MGIADWPEDQKPREKLLQRGADSLTDPELLAIILRTGVRGKSAVDLARELLERVPGLLRSAARRPRRDPEILAAWGRRSRRRSRQCWPSSGARSGRR